MKKTTIKMISLILMIMIVFTATNAMAVYITTAAENFISLAHCNIYMPEKLDLSGEKPVLIFFPGNDECNNIRKVPAFMENNHLYDDLDVSLMGVASKRKGYDSKGWQKTSQDIVDYLKNDYEKNHFDILIDCVSIGGYPGVYLTELFRNNGIIVKELTLADAVVEGMVSTDWLQEQAKAGTQVNIYACETNNTKTSMPSREAIEKLKGTENFLGKTIPNTPHAEVLGKAIHKYGLHEEYRIKDAPAKKTGVMVVRKRPEGYFETQTSQWLRRCVISEPATNDYTSGDPVYVFFPGTGEMASIRKVIGFEKKYRLYNTVDANIISVATKGSVIGPKEWKGVALDIADYIAEKYAANPFDIMIDTVSFGGRGGVYLAQILQEMNIPVKQLNLGDSCGPMGSYTIKPEDLIAIAENGTEINIVASDRTSNWSKGSRKMIEDTKNIPNIHGHVIHGSHGEALGMAINERGIHN